MKLRHLLMAGGLIVSAWLTVFGNKAGSQTVVEAVPRALRKMPSTTTAETGSESEILPLHRKKTSSPSASTAVSSMLFATHIWMPPAPRPPKPPPPAAPPLPFTYIGKEQRDGKWSVFLAQGNLTLVVRADEKIGDQYQITKIEPPTLELTYLPLNQTQTITIE